MFSTSVVTGISGKCSQPLAGELLVDAFDIAAVQMSLRPLAHVYAFGAKVYAVDAIADPVLGSGAVK